MEQARYWMWARRKLSSSTRSSLQSSYGDSWEEQAFAEDSAAALGGCVWPPRSYSCSFCRREFRSAQALGGHMNVHRRDRARLKQSPNTHILENHDHQNLPCTTTPLLGHLEYPPQVCTSLLYNNLIPNTNPTSPSKLSSAPSTQENSSEQTLLVCPCNPSSKSLELRKDDPFSPLIPSLPAHFSTLQRENYPKVGEMGCQLQRDYYVRPDSAVQPMDSSMCWSLQQQPHSGGEDEELISSTKRRRKVVSLSAPIIKHNIPSEKNRNDASLPFFMNLGTPAERIHPQSEVLGLGLGPVDDLDLELRLGSRPKVK